MKRAALYVRVSTVEQREQGQSVDSQLVGLQEYAAANGYSVAGIYNDSGISAHVKYTRRPALLRLIEDCQAGKVDVILVTKLDRFFRSVKDYYAVMEQIGKVSWRAIWEDYETETSAGIFKVNIMLSVAQAESDRTAERVKAVNDYRRAKGEFVGGKIPLGYLLENKHLVKNPLVQDAVFDFFQTYIKTLSQARAIEAAASYGLQITRSHAKQLLKSAVYAGNAYGCPCPAYITPEEYQLILDSFLGRRNFSDGKAVRVYMFAGLMRCEKCGGAMVSHYTSKLSCRKRYHYKSYRCMNHENLHTCSGVGLVYESTVENYLLKEIEQLIAQYNSDISFKFKSEKQKPEEKIKKLRARLSRVGDRYEDGDISRSEYLEKRHALLTEISEVEAAATLDCSVVSLPENWRDIYAALDDEHKRSFWNRIIKKIIRTADKSFIVEFR